MEDNKLLKWISSEDLVMRSHAECCLGTMGYLSSHVWICTTKIWRSLTIILCASWLLLGMEWCKKDKISRSSSAFSLIDKEKMYRSNKDYTLNNWLFSYTWIQYASAFFMILLVYISGPNCGYYLLFNFKIQIEGFISLNYSLYK